MRGLRDEGIVRNRLKIVAAIQNHWRTMAKVPARTAESDAMSRDLLRRGLKFASSTICYALMQATGWRTIISGPVREHVELGGNDRR